MWIQLANVKPGQRERFLELRRRLLAKAANSPVITAWYTFDMDVGRGVGPLADQGCMDGGCRELADPWKKTHTQPIQPREVKKDSQLSWVDLSTHAW